VVTEFDLSFFIEDLDHRTKEIEIIALKCVMAKTIYLSDFTPLDPLTTLVDEGD
jgi:hypothetical protein